MPAPRPLPGVSPSTKIDLSMTRYTLSQYAARGVLGKGVCGLISDLIEPDNITEQCQWQQLLALPRKAAVR